VPQAYAGKGVDSERPDTAVRWQEHHSHTQKRRRGYRCLHCVGSQVWRKQSEALAHLQRQHPHLQPTPSPLAAITANVQPEPDQASSPVLDGNGGHLLFSDPFPGSDDAPRTDEASEQKEEDDDDDAFLEAARRQEDDNSAGEEDREGGFRAGILMREQPGT
jgi:hypothetical protein